MGDCSLGFQKSGNDSPIKLLANFTGKTKFFNVVVLLADLSSISSEVFQRSLVSITLETSVKSLRSLTYYNLSLSLLNRALF